MLKAPYSKHLGKTLAPDNDAADRTTFTPNSCCFYFGPSMHPTLKEQDLVEITPFSKTRPRKGDVILFTPPGMRQAVIHRITDLDNKGLTTRGDNCSNTDPWELHYGNLVGRVSAAYRDGIKRSIAGGLQGRYVAAYCRAGMHVLPMFRHCLRPIVRFLQLIAAHIPFPASKKAVRIIRFYHKTGPQYKLMRGTSVIGYYNHHNRQWYLRKRYRLFVKESSLTQAFQLKNDPSLPAPHCDQ